MAETQDATVVARRKAATGESPDPSASTVTPDHATAATSAATHASTRKLTTRTPAETMRAEEVLRTRGFLRVVLAMQVAVGALLPLLGGDPTLKRLLFGAMGATFVCCAGFLWYIRDEANYSVERALVPAAVCIGTVTIASYFFGFFSPAPMVLTLGIYFFSLSGSLSASIVVYLATAVLNLAATALVAIDVLPDRGLVRAIDVPRFDQLVIAVLVQLVLALTFVVARLSRRATLNAIERLELALRQVGQREALLQEARFDLERALRGGHGRLSGERLGPWRLGEVIGRGAMGEVYEAQHAERDQRAAVKVLHAEVMAEPDQLRRFLREAEVMSRLDSPHVVRVHDVGLGADGRPPYIAMERLSGHDLAWHLRKRRRLQPARVVELVAQVASALEQARAHEIVHRDLKPQNVFCVEEGESRVWKVLDFGVSKLGNKAGTLTRGHVIGTPGYMAPEQARGGAIDHRADVFSLGVIAYRALTGRPAFSGDEYPKIMFDIVYLQPKRPSEVASLPEDVDLALALVLVKEPLRRLDTAAAFAEALRLAVDGALPSALRERAARLVERHPWGARAKEA